MGRGLPVIVFTVILSGCALPVPLQIASWALDGISFLTTDKSISDHGISLVAQKDCALWRGLKGEDICSENDESGAFAIASADSAPFEGQQPETLSLTEESSDETVTLASFETAAGSPEIAPDVIAKPAATSKNGEKLMISGKRLWSARLDADIYYVIGSFSDRDNARRMINKYQELGPAVMASRLDGVEVYRIAVGPFTADQKKEMRLRLKLVGIGNAWAMRVDHRNWTLASPKELSAPAQSVAAVPQNTPLKKIIKPAPVEFESDEIAKTPVDPDVEAGQSSEWIDSEKQHLVIGSFSNPENANNFSKTMADLSPRVLSFETSQGWRYRVVIGPYAKTESLEVRRNLAHAGIDHVWALNLTPDTIPADILLADMPVDADLTDEGQGEEIAENLVVDRQVEVSTQPSQPASLDEQSGWGVNLVEYIFDMFRSTNSTEVVGIVPPLES